MKRFILLILSTAILSGVSKSQNKANETYLSFAGGPFSIGKNTIPGLWANIEVAETIFNKKTSRVFQKTCAGIELYFQIDADKATVYNPAYQQFISERFFHESDIGISPKIIFKPFDGFFNSFYLSAGPAIIYSIQSFEKRAQTIVYSPSQVIRMSEIGVENKILAGYRFSIGYDLNLKKGWRAGVLANFSQYSTRDITALWGLKLSKSI